jgi:thiol-disulfide isomerase/thioredoxin
MRFLAVFVPVLILSSAVGCNSEARLASKSAGGNECCPPPARVEVKAVQDSCCSREAILKPSCCEEQAQSTPPGAGEQIEALPAPRSGIFQAKPQGCESKKPSGCCESKGKDSGCGGKKEAGSGCGDKEKKESGCETKPQSNGAGCGDKAASKASSGCESKEKGSGCGETEKKDAGCGSKPQSKASGCGGQAAVDVKLEAGDGQGKIEWLTNLPAALKVAAEEEKAVLVVFDAEWCAPSRKMRRTTLADSRVAEIANLHFVRVMIDTDKNPEAADRYRVEEIPTTVVLAPDGTPVFRHEDVAGASTFEAVLQEADVAFLQYRDLKRRVDAEPKGVEPLLELARLLHRQGSFAAAAEAAEKALARAEAESCCGSRKVHAEIAAFVGECHVEARADGEALDRIAAKLEELDANGELGFRDNALFFRAVACVVREEPAEAMSKLNRLVSDHPGSDKAESAAIWMAWIELEKLENRDGAAQMLRAFIARYPDSGYRPLAERLLRQAAGRGK